MDVETRAKLVTNINKEAFDIFIAKGNAYAGTGKDTLANFKRNAERLGLSKYQVWAVYFNKHIDSINNSIEASPNAPIDATEGLKGRIIDAKNYLDILYCLLYEDGKIR